MSERVHVTVSFDWTPAGAIALDADDKPAFPRLPRAPGIYKLTLNGPDGTRAIYVGEAVDLKRRCGNYRNPGPSQRTSQRIHALLKSQLAIGTRIAIALATKTTLEINGVSGELDPSRKASRLLAENAALVTAALAGADRIENL